MSLESFLCDKGKQCNPRSERDTPKIGNGLVLLIRVGKFIQLKWVNKRIKPFYRFDRICLKLSFTFTRPTSPVKDDGKTSAPTKTTTGTPKFEGFSHLTLDILKAANKNSTTVVENKKSNVAM